MRGNEKKSVLPLFVRPARMAVSAVPGAPSHTFLFDGGRKTSAAPERPFLVLNQSARYQPRISLAPGNLHVVYTFHLHALLTTKAHFGAASLNILVEPELFDTETGSSVRHKMPHQTAVVEVNPLVTKHVVVFHWQTNLCAISRSSAPRGAPEPVIGLALNISMIMSTQSSRLPSFQLSSPVRLVVEGKQPEAFASCLTTSGTYMRPVEDSDMSSSSSQSSDSDEDSSPAPAQHRSPIKALHDPRLVV